MAQRACRTRLGHSAGTDQGARREGHRNQQAAEQNDRDRRSSDRLQAESQGKNRGVLHAISTLHSELG